MRLCVCVPDCPACVLQPPNHACSEAAKRAMFSILVAAGAYLNAVIPGKSYTGEEQALCWRRPSLHGCCRPRWAHARNLIVEMPAWLLLTPLAPLPLQRCTA